MEHLHERNFHNVESSLDFVQCFITSQLVTGMVLVLCLLDAIHPADVLDCSLIYMDTYEVCSYKTPFWNYSKLFL